jgi:hypothetical protein
MAFRLKSARITLANLNPAPGSQHKVSVIQRFINNPALSYDHQSSKNVWGEDKDLVMVERLVVALMAKSLALVLE